MFRTLVVLGLLFGILSACGPSDDRLAQAPGPNLQPYYDFFNDIRLEIADLQEEYPRLEGFLEETKDYLESRESQQLYDLSGLYFEKNLNRQQGAHNYADRFFEDGMVLHFIVYPAKEQFRFEQLLGRNKGYGKQVGQQFVYYQVFTAKPTDLELEEAIKNIVDRNIEKHAQYIGGTQ